MKAELRAKRRNDIMDVAIDLLAERGYRDASMLEIAKRASASKETLYAWFGDKRGLFEAVIRRNAETVRKVLVRHLPGHAPTEVVLAEFGAALLELLLGDSAVAINRAAISEARSDPTFAQTLSRTGRDATLPIFIRTLERHHSRGTLRIENSAQAAEIFLGLLLGDMQIRRLLGVLPPLKTAEMEARASRVAKTFMRLYTLHSLEQ